MKNKLILFILSLSIIGLGACRKNCCDAGPQPDFMATFKGPSEWSAKRTEANVYQDSTFLFGSVGEEHLTMRIKFTGVGKYILTGSQARYSVTIGGDVTGVEYFADPALESFLNIEGYDADKKIMFGKFTLNTLRYYRYDPLDPYYSKKLAFTNGSFKIALAK